MKKTRLARVPTGIRNLDAVLDGGLPKNSVTLLAGPPGAGKTILTQQIVFHNATEEARVLWFNTLSEPTAKTLRYMSGFSFFDPARLERAIQFVDLGGLIRARGLAPATTLLLDNIKQVKPTIVVIDSFKVFSDFASSAEDLRKFSYELAVNLMAWEATAFLLGEYGQADIETNPLLSIVDGLVIVSRRELSGEQQRFLQIAKMRGTKHSLEEHSFEITDDGIEVFALRAPILEGDEPSTIGARCATGISKLDDLIVEGIPRGSSLLVSGVAGTGKTTFLLEFIYRGAVAGEKGLLISFEETRPRLLAAARGFGWDIDRQIELGMIEIVFLPPPDIRTDAHLALIQARVEAMKAQRLAIDSVSVFLQRVTDPQISRQKLFQLATIVANSGVVGFLATDIPYGSSQISRFGVEETVVDGVILLSAIEEDLDRQRYIEIYKLRNTAHLSGRHAMTIERDGIAIFPRYGDEQRFEAPPLETSRRLSSGILGLDPLLGGGLLERSVTLLSGSAGIGKSTMGIQFVLEGARRGEPGVFVTTEEGRAQILRSAEALGLPLDRAVEAQAIDVVQLGRESVRAPQFLAILADAIRARKARRVVIDGIGHLLAGGASAESFHQILSSLVAQFKLLGVTSVLTLESESLFAGEFVSGRSLSPLSDNLVMMRYTHDDGRLQPLITVVKTRGSSHDWASHPFVVAEGGVRIDGPASGLKARRGARPAVTSAKLKPKPSGGATRGRRKR